MKLRFRGNSLRLRLGRSEIARLLSAQSVEEATDFGAGQRLIYRLRASADVSAPIASFHDAQVEVVLPMPIALAWAQGEQVGIESEQPIGAGATLRLLIEKDFACLTAPGAEDQADAFPHPDAGPCGPAKQ